MVANRSSAFGRFPCISSTAGRYFWYCEKGVSTFRGSRARPTLGYLVLSDVEMIHVDERDDVAVLVVVQKDADLVERKLHVEPRCLFVQFVVHLDLRAHAVSGACL